MKEKDLLNIFNEVLDGKRGPLAPIVAYTEAAEDKEDKQDKSADKDDTVIDFEEPKKEDDKDDMDEVDDVFKNIDLKSISNDAKIELISNVIQILQDSVEDDDEFSEYMNQIQEIIDGYQFDSEGEEEPEGEEKPEGEEEPEGEEPEIEEPEEK